MLSPSDIVVRQPDHMERLTQDLTGAPVHPEPTPTTMAERFAPEAQDDPDDDGPVQPAAPPQLAPGLMAEGARVFSAGSWLLISAILVSLIPTALILVFLWQGIITVPGSGEVAKIADRAPILASEQPAAAPAPAPVPAPVVNVEPEIALTAPSQIAAKSGEKIPFTIAIDSSEALPARSIIAIRAMPEGALFSQGRPYGISEWNLTPDEISDLKLSLPDTARGVANLRIELMAADGKVLASAATKLDIAPDPKTALVLRSNERDRIADLIAHGHKMVDVGYLAGARAYFKRAAEAGSGDAALLLGATFDPEFIDRIGAHGIKADPQEARGWYERAKQLGVEDAESKLKALKEDMAGPGHPIRATDASTKSPELGVAKPAEPEKAEETTESQVAQEETGSVAETVTALAADGNEWVELNSYVNLRTAPSSEADTIKVGAKGAKLRVTGREGNWVQVTDPQTSEVAWVYGRYIEMAQAPTHQ
jgi:Bacterial SH3 domain